jgi:prophage DNA circulation protein
MARNSNGMPSNPWRQRWRQASFKGATFYVEHDSRASGRRVALHQYPKRDTPYAEDMGRRAVRHIVNGYQIGPNYIGPRDSLISALESEGPGMLVHPLLGQMNVMCDAYSVSERRVAGGMCVFEMSFVESGAAGDSPAGQATAPAVNATAGHSDGAAIAALQQATG